MADGPFIGPDYTVADLVASADDATMVEAYVVGIAVPQDAEQEEGDNDDIEALFGDDDNVDVPVTFDKQAALFASIETAHCKKETRRFMTA
jgi:hypothetical protein